ncbi:subclass B3 metallo-beta-lactamase [Sphingomonas astaxanthinifaciens]|uniref:Subclass B3 metallo-beta-lactamase BJP-1 n=1 Tax=Sphingomonas astaxanthinifaciens DSM 22298 TaxID=1123267 RepID=A0ABQ5Z7C0_9SPHN|nr:subclass B3 metallo-beta-lactamase [Sphingomonas astaxanthinifaciens]GLR47326.1 subclass B3 metallo-beta-lactamase BJP-1 [Sphingomonas astaxanthinifaciens DSM 22298]
MFAKTVLVALAAAQITIPLGGAKPVEKLPAPIAVAGPAFARVCRGSDDWDKPAPPIRLHGNTYYVGTCGIAAILITDKDGDILIDTGTEKGADLVAANIRRLGFQMGDVKYILHSHEHVDHVGGMARMQQLTGGEVIASAAAAAAFRTGLVADDDPQRGVIDPVPRVPVARTVKDGDTVRVGAIQLTAHATPGHTAGALSWSWVSCDGGVCRSFVFADSLSPVSRDDYRFTDHPELVAAFRSSIAKVAALDCDILLTPHPSASNMAARFAGTAPLFDPKGCADYAAAKTRQLDERLAKEATK